MANNTPAPKPESQTEQPLILTADILASALKQVLGAESDKHEKLLNAVLGSLPKQKPLDAITPEYLADPRNKVQRLQRPAFQNGYPVNPDGLSDATIQKLAELTTGKYLGGVITIHVDDSAERATNINYRNKTMAERFEMQRQVSSFSDMIDKCHAEMRARQGE